MRDIEKQAWEALDYFSFKYFSERMILVFYTTESQCREIEFVAGESQNTQKLGTHAIKQKEKSRNTIGEQITKRRNNN